MFLKTSFPRHSQLIASETEVNACSQKQYFQQPDHQDHLAAVQIRYLLRFSLLFITFTSQSMEICLHQRNVEGGLAHCVPAVSHIVTDQITNKQKKLNQMQTSLRQGIQCNTNVKDEVPFSSSEITDVKKSVNPKLRLGRHKVSHHSTGIDKVVFLVRPL